MEPSFFVYRGSSQRIPEDSSARGFSVRRFSAWKSLPWKDTGQKGNRKNAGV